MTVRIASYVAWAALAVPSASLALPAPRPPQLPRAVSWSFDHRIPGIADAYVVVSCLGGSVGDPIFVPVAKERRTVAVLRAIRRNAERRQFDLKDCTFRQLDAFATSIRKRLATLGLLAPSKVR